MKDVNDPVLKEIVADELLRMAYAYALKNPIRGIELDDYAHDLFMNVWRRLSSYKDTCASFSAYCYLWFRSYRSVTIRKIVGTPQIDSLDVALLNQDLDFGRESTLLDLISIEQPETHRCEFFEHILNDPKAMKVINDNVGKELNNWTNGQSQAQIAKELGIAQRTVNYRINKNVMKIRALLKEEGYE